MAEECPSCDVCAAWPCQGGCRNYVESDGTPRHGCDDDAACLEMWKLIGRP